MVIFLYVVIKLVLIRYDMEEMFELQYDLKPLGAVIRVNSEKGCVLRICQIPKELIFDEQGNVREFVDIIFPKVEKPNGNERQYVKDITKQDYGDLMTAEDWNQAVDEGYFTNWDGSGYWVKDGLESGDEVFGTPQLDATHVMWYNK